MLQAQRRSVQNTNILIQTDVYYRIFSASKHTFLHFAIKHKSRLYSNPLTEAPALRYAENVPLSASRSADHPAQPAWSV